MKRTLLLLFFLFALCCVHAQMSRLIPCPPECGHILTVRTEVKGLLDPLPILTLGSRETIEVSFDEMSHDYHRYIYRLQHCDFRWKPSEGLFYTEYAESTQDGVPIEDYVESRNVMTHYTHYSFSFPNADMRPLLSGNYRLTILCDDDEPVPVAEVALRVVEPCVSVTAEVTTNTEVDTNDSHQQLSMSVDATGLAARDLRDEIHTVILQNDRLDNAVVDPPVSYINGMRLIWEHQRQLAFPAGNEYRSYEILSERYPGYHTDNIRYHEPFLHATIMSDERSRHYLAKDDLNGTCIIRNTDNDDDATETEYMLTHFTLLCDDPYEDGDVFLNGKWATGGIAPEWRLTYNAEEKAYTGTFMLKQGYYNYQYLFVSRDAQLRRTPFGQPMGQTAPFEGDFFQTSNDYRILVYHIQPGARYDRLVGTAIVKY